MATGVVDGAIIVDTGLNNSGFMKEARQFRAALEGLKQSVDRIGDVMEKSSERFVSSVVGMSKAIQKVTYAMQTQGAAADQAAVANDGAAQSVEALAQAEAAAVDPINEVKKAQQEQAKSGAQSVGAWTDAMEEEYRALVEAGTAISEAQRNMEQQAGINVVDDGSMEAGRNMLNISEAIRLQIVEIEREYGRQLAAIREIEDAMADYRAEAEQAAAVNTSEGAETRTEEIRQAVQGASEAMNQESAAASGLGRAFARVASSAVSALRVIGRFSGHGAVTALKKLAAGAKNAAIQLAKLSGRAISTGFKTLGSGVANVGRWMLGLNKSSGQASDGLKRGLLTLLRYGLGIRGLFALFRRLRTAIADGLGEIEKRNPKVKASLDAFRASLSALKASLATAFAPIVTAVAPALTTLINMLTAAINTIGAFIAALTGQGTYQKAVSGFNATGNAAGGAAKDVEKLNRQLAGFDELNILNDKNSGGGGGGGGGGSGSGFSYTTEEISSGITDFVGKLKELWAAADYEGIGREIAGVINSAFEKAKELISWDNLGEKITEAVDAITGIFNGLVDGIDFELIGETLGEGINTIIKAVNQLLTKINWENLGKKFAEGLNGLVSTVNWKELGTLFANKLNALIKSIKGIVENFNWGEAGKAFAETLNSLISDIDWDALVKTATSAINRIAAGLRTAVRKFDWESAATTFADTLSGLLSGIDWNGLVTLASSSINRIAAALRTAIRKFEWGDAGKTFGDTVNGIISEVDWANLGKLVSEAIGGPLETIKNAVLKFDFGEAGKAFADTINGFFSNEKLWTDAATTVSESIKGLFVWGKNFFDDLDTDQIAADIKDYLKTIDWAGIAKTIWDFLVSALKAIGSLLWELLVDTEVPPETAAAVEKEVEQLVAKIHPELAVTWGIDLNSEHGQEQYDALVDAFQKALKGEGFKVPAELDIPKESIYAAYLEFVDEWNRLHPTSPITPILPEEVDKLIQKDWDEQDVSLETDVAPTIDEEQFSKNWDEFADHPFDIDTVANITTTPKQLGKDFKGIWAQVPDADKIVKGITALKKGKAKDGIQSVAPLYSDKAKKVKGFTALKKDSSGNQSVSQVYSDRDKKVKGAVDLVKGNYTSLQKFVGTEVDVKVNLKDGKISGAVKDVIKHEGGGIITAGGRSIGFAAGGVVNNSGLARYLSGVPHYAAGTNRAHGTVFVAGEAGPEIMGHINGRTEILNKSQLAQAIYGAVVSGMSQAVNALGKYLGNQLATCTNAVVATVGNLAAVSGIAYHEPVMASGSVLPYEVAAQIARTGADLQQAMDANTEDLIQTIISVIGAQTTALVSALRTNQQQNNGTGLTAQQLINQLNQRAQMFGRSPIMD